MTGFPPTPAPHRYYFDHVLGTTLELQITTDQAEMAHECAEWIVADFKRREAIFSVFDPQSDLCQWRSGTTQVGTQSELGQLLILAQQWRDRTGGAFNPLVGMLVDEWNGSGTAIDTGSNSVPNGHAIHGPLFERSGNQLVAVPSSSALTLNAIAKGHIVDRVAAQAMRRFGLTSLVLSAGGDLLHIGTGSQHVGIEDPARPFDNVAPLTIVEISNAALATSGSARRHIEIGVERFSHLIDPIAGRPADAVLSATALAIDATTADVVATALSVLAPTPALSLADRLPDVACLVIDAEGARHTNARWDLQAGAG